MTDDLITLPADGKAVPCFSPNSLEPAVSRMTSARTTGTKSSPWTLASAAVKVYACPGISQTSEFLEAPSRQADFLGTPDCEGDLSPSAVDAAQLRRKLEKLAFGARGMRRPEIYARRLDGASRGSSKNNMASMSGGQTTPLSVHSVSAPPYPAACPQTPQSSQLPWLQLSGSQFSMPSSRALLACAGDASQRPVSSQGVRPSSSSGTRFPPLPGSVGDGIGSRVSLRNVARSPQVGRWHADLNAFQRDARCLDAAWGQAALQSQTLIAEPEPEPQCSKRRRRKVGSYERKKSLPWQPCSPSLPRKRSRLKRMLSSLWRLGHSRRT